MECGIEFLRWANVWWKDETVMCDKILYKRIAEKSEIEKRDDFGEGE